MTGALIRALLSHWWRSPLQLVTLLAGLSLGTALWSAVQAINAEARASYAAAAATMGQAGLARITAADGGPIAQDLYVALRRAGWLVSPVIEGDWQGIRLIGVDPLTTPGGAVPVAGVDPVAMLAGPGQILAHPRVIDRLPPGPDPLPAPGLAPGSALTDIGLAQRLLDRPGQIDRLIVAPVLPLTRPPLAGIAPGLVLTPAAQGGDVARLTDSFHLNLTAFGLLAFVVGLFIVHGAVGLTFEQRRPMVRTLRALGVPLGRLIWLMVAELAGLALLAGALGIAMGYWVAAALMPDVAATLRGLYGAEVAGQLAVRPVWWISGLAMALGGAGLAAGGSLWGLARMPLLAGAHPRAWAMARQGRGAALGAVGLMALAGGLVVWGQGLIAGFAMLAALLLGAALALPPVLATVLRLAEGAARRPVAQWFWADTRQQLPGLSLALMALLLAMAANVGVSTMVSSFRLTFTGFLDQRLASELYVTATPDQADAIAGLDGITAILPILSVDQPVAGQPASVYGVRDHATYRDNWRMLRAAPQVWDRLAAGEGVLVNEQLYRRAGLDLGTMVQVAPGLTLPVLGIYGDYGNPIGQVILSEPLFRAHFPKATPHRYGLRTPQPKALRTALAGLGLPPSAIVDQAAIKAASLAVFERTFAVTAALNVLTLAVAGLAILLSLLTLAAMRLPQVAPVWALGLTRRRLALLDLARAGVLAALTAVLALPLGLALAWALLAVVNVEAFGWRLPMYVFPLDYLRLALLAVIAAALAALWPAWQLSRMAPARLLGVFRHER